MRKTALVISFILGISLLPITTIAVTPASAAPTTILFEDVQANNVILGVLASRSQNAQLSRSGAASPYTMSALATAGRGAYSYQTDSLYGKTQTPPPTDKWTGHGGCGVNEYSAVGCLTQLRESDERPNSTSANKIGFSGNKTGTDTPKTGIIQLNTLDGWMAATPSGGISTNERANGEFSFGTVFGPEIYSVPFLGSAGQAISYQWKAAGTNDDYEVYGFLVKISDNSGKACTSASGVGTYGLTNPTSTHTIVTYGRGTTADWTTATGSIGTDGCYRFRFVGGTYDASGGLRAGASFSIYDVKLGEAQNLVFTQPADMLKSTFSRTFTAVATSNAPGATLVFASTTPTICAVSGTTVTVLANKEGTCSLRVDSAAVGDYGSAPTAYSSFQVQSTNTKPISNGGNSILGDAKVCSTLTVVEGSWSDGGASITGTSYQWKKNGSAIIGSTSSTYIVQSTDVGAVISYDISKTNSEGTTSATSSSIIPLDARLSNLSISSGSLSPTFNGCSFSYSASLSTSSIRIIPTVASADATVTVGGSAVVSGQPSGAIALNAGSNTVLLVVTNGAQSTTTTLTITYGEAPAVAVLAPTSLTGTGGTLNATVNAKGQSTSDIRFEISTSPTFTSDAFIVNATPSTATGTVDTNMSALSPALIKETTYYVRAFATNASGTTTSSIFSFTTPAAPIATSNSASSLSSTGATLNGSVVGNGDSEGSDTTVIFQYSLNSDMSSPTEVNPTTNAVIAGGDKNSSSVSIPLTGLQTGSTYYFLVKATNNYGSNYGSILNFTLKGAPSVSTQSASSITSTAADLNGIVNANGDATTSIIFNWGTSAGSLTNTISVTPTTVSGNLNTSVLGRLTGLAPNITYYYKLSATNSIGTTQSTPTTSFTTIVDARPSAILSAPSNSLTSQPFTVTVTFSEAVTGFLEADIVLTGTDNAKWTKQIAQEISKSVYTVEFRPNSPSAGTLTVGLAQDVVLDSTSQKNTAATSVNVITSTSVIAPVISYPSYTISGAQNSLITTLVPTNTGGIIAEWSISAPLPTGLFFSTSSGQFYGTPTISSPSTQFVVTATNAAGSDAKTVTVSVEGPPVISYTPSTVSAIVGTAITSLAPTNSGVAATSWSVSPSLPIGLSLNASTGVLSGTPSTTSQSSTFIVTATSSAGSPGSTTIIVSVAAQTVPGQPTSLSGIAGAGQATLNWVSPTDNGGASIITYRIEYSSNGGSNWTEYQHPNSSSTSLTVTGLNNGTSYIFRVAATNGAGSGSASSASNAVTPFAADRPDAPTIGIGTVVDSQTVTVSFSAPANNRGAAITNYTATSSPGGITASSANSPITVTGLTVNTAYTFTVTATNSAGTSDSSTATSSITPKMTYSVTFNSQGGSSISDGSFISGESVIAPTSNPTRSGYTYNGWFAAATGGSVLVFPYSPGVTNNITVYAQWTAIPVVIPPSPTPVPVVVTGPPPSSLKTITSPKISRDDKGYYCQVGKYVFLREGHTEETPKLTTQVFSLLSNGTVIESIKSALDKVLFTKSDTYLESTLTCQVEVGQENLITTSYSLNSADISTFASVRKSAIEAADVKYYKDREDAYAKKDQEFVRLAAVKAAAVAASKSSKEIFAASANYQKAYKAASELWKKELADASTNRVLARDLAQKNYLESLESAGISIYPTPVKAAVTPTPTPSPTPKPTPTPTPTPVVTTNPQPTAQMVKVGTVYMATGSYSLNDATKITLKAIALKINASDAKSILVYGHTDSRGGVNNTVLSQNSAKAVANYLRPLLKGKKITVDWYASRKPVTGGNSAADLAKNRRVEVYSK